ncbi:60S ribosomal protein L37 [Cucumispora dikerogammari]|nr:60S ribosomal protein L37 [Cucumispora dikerogammari]
MPKGTPSNGKKNKRNHIICQRCHKNSFHKQKQKCASCAFPAPKWRRDLSDKTKEKRLQHSKVQGKNSRSGNMTHIKKVVRAKRNGYKLNPIVAAALNALKK